jgi:hypothetical protein
MDNGVYHYEGTLKGEIFYLKKEILNTLFHRGELEFDSDEEYLNYLIKLEKVKNRVELQEVLKECGLKRLTEKQYEKWKEKIIKDGGEIKSRATETCYDKDGKLVDMKIYKL